MKSSFKTAAATLASVLALTVSSVAMADEPAAPPAPAAAAPAGATPLQTRAVKKLEMAKNESSPIGYKLLAGAVVVAGAVVYAKKKKGGLTKDKAKKKSSSIDLLARHSVGVRSEVLVVEVEGTRLLVGMTPGSMNTLAVLQTPEGVIGEESPYMGEEKFMTQEERESAPVRTVDRSAPPELSDEEDDQPAIKFVGRKSAQTAQQEEADELEGRVRSLLDARKKKAEPAPRALPARRPVPQPQRQASATSGVPGQAKGLLLTMQDADVTKLGDW